MYNLPKRTIILAGGGSGGHVFPALALSEHLITRGWIVFFVTDQRGIAFAKEFPKQVQKIVIDFPNPWSGGKLRFLSSIWFFTKSLLRLFIFFRKVKASAVMGFGGYPSAASMVVASILRLPTAIHEQNSTLGRVNKLFASTVNLLVFGIKPVVELSRASKTLVLGNPIRKSILQVSPIDYAKLAPQDFVVLVQGGSQGASFVSSIVCDTIIGLPKKVRKKIKIFHQCRQEDLSKVQTKYAKFDVNATVKIFFDDISNHLNLAHLVISRSGASSIAEICIFGRPSILIPLPSAVGNHQAKNASVMEEAGASIVLSQEETSVTDLRSKILFIMTNFQMAHEMSVSAKKMSKPLAAEEMADELEKLL